jgi:hypothetical protein
MVNVDLLVDREGRGEIISSISVMTIKPPSTLPPLCYISLEYPKWRRSDGTITLILQRRKRLRKKLDVSCKPHSTRREMFYIRKKLKTNKQTFESLVCP